MEQAMTELSFYIAMVGTVAFASSAVLSLAEKRADLFAASVIGILTAIGGGTVRDIVLDVPVFWASDLSYVWVALGTTVVTFYAYSIFQRRTLPRLFLYVDALATSMFAIQATHKVWDLEFGLPIAPVLLGVISAFGGGIIRDVLLERPTMLMSRDLYAVPVVLGCICFTLILTYAWEYRIWGYIACIIMIFVIRSAAIRWNLRVPDWATMGYARASPDAGK
jgi:uncharacterized membrane protein YeiH